MIKNLTPSIIEGLHKLNQEDLTKLIKHSVKPIVCGIYFLFRDEKLIYVGKSVDIHKRMYAHKNKNFNSYKYLEVDYELLNVTERFFINKYMPILNKDALTTKLKSLIK